jgi:hypothetical protein
LWAIYTSERLFYQDKLGTNIGKVEKRGGVFAGRYLLLTDDPVRQNGIFEMPFV